MPFSQSTQLSAIVCFAEQLRPKSVLDVGTGMGQYGFLLRTNLEHLNLFEINGSSGKLRDRGEWAIKIDGIEGCKTYLTPVHEYSYNKVFVGNALDILPTIRVASYDLVMAIDILEHLSKADGKIFLAQCFRIASRAVLVSTPKLFVQQEIPANPLENHRSLWTQADLLELGFTSTLPNENSWVVHSLATGST